MKSGEYINKYGIKQRLYYRVTGFCFPRTIFYKESVVGIKSKFNWKKFKFEKYEKLFEIEANVNDFYISAEWWDKSIQEHFDLLERKKDILYGNIWNKTFR